MRDKKDNATFDLPGFGQTSLELITPVTQEAKRAPARIKKAGLRQEQLELLEPTDSSGLPVWTRDENLDLTGLPVWAPA
ncbi:MAG TPA: hypothetical protein VGP06_05820 [Janthinobacterium sp.]|jgi:hypothetical protein|nr:hypothetical protein [Janthinobacterium sp.]